ncbi:MAG: hypothetical protein CMM50_00745 [Rhodospirillaceae bacterium]|nr:hypothetical protein [Rhodospirillaceae bacterium]
MTTAAFATAFLASGWIVAGPAEGAEMHGSVAQVIQVLPAFDNPEGAIFSADGTHVFVSNAAELGDKTEGLAWGEGIGYISKLKVLESGKLEMVEPKLIDGLTAPLGMGVLPVATGTFPKGTIFACVGSAPFRTATGEAVTDPARMRTKLLAFDESGKVLGEIDTGSGSIFEEINGSPVLLINALGFDGDGNLYFADTAFGGDQFEPKFEGKPGLWKIPAASLDALAAGEKPAEMPTFLMVPGFPDGVEVSPKDGMVYVNTVGPVAGAPDPANGGIYAVSDMTAALPAPVDRDLGALDGLDFTAGGTMLNSQIKGDVPVAITVTCPGGKSTALAFDPETTLSGPADVAIRRSSGAQLMVIPELTARDSTPGDDEVTVVLLPADFDGACMK